MEFSAEEQIKKSERFLESMVKPECNGCKRGIRMCHTTPCVGTVEDMERIMDAGYSKNLMLDWWVGVDSAEKSLKSSLNKDKIDMSFERRTNPFKEDVSYLVPAIVDYQGKKAPFSRTGTCVLLVDDKCSIHSIKPTQGSMACCQISRVYLDEKGEEKELDERLPILHTWNSQRGKDLIERWKKEVSFDNSINDGADVPTTLMDMLETLFAVFENKAKSLESYEEESKQHEGKEPQVLTYENPY